MRSLNLFLFLPLALLATPSVPATWAQSSPPSQTQDAATPEVARIKPIHSPTVPFPVEALEKHVEGTVLVNLKVEANGEVSEVKPLSGPPELYVAAIDSAMQWKFDPPAHAVDVRYEINYFFSKDKECPGAVSDRGEVLVSGRTPNKNGVVITFDNDDDGELLQDYNRVRKAGVSGDTVLSFRIGSDGKVKQVRVVKSLTRNLDRAALRSARKWKFTVQRGNPEFLPADFEFTISFRAICHQDS
jgi:TonB family protein